MAEAPITRFDPDEGRLAVLMGCINPFGAEIPPGVDWLANMLSLRTVVYGSGRIARAGDPVRHNIDPDELALCRSLAAAARPLIGNSEGVSSEGAVLWQEFFVAANLDDPSRERIDEALIRDRFGGTILPLATVGIQPLTEEGAWWKSILDDARGDAAGDFEAEERGLELETWMERALGVARSVAEHGMPPEPEEYQELVRDEETFTVEGLIPWLRLIRFFQGPEFRDAAYVEIGDYSAYERVPKAQWPPGMESWPVQLPRLFVGLTRKGSLAGLFAYIVQT